MRSPIAEERAAANVIFDWLEMESQFLRSRSIQKQAKSVKRFMDDLLLMPELIAKLELLNLNVAINSLHSTTKQIEENYLVRMAEKKAAKLKADKLRSDAFEAIEVFVVAIEQTVKLKKGDVDLHLHYLNQIHGIVAGFQTEHENRATRRKNAAEAAEAEANQNANPENGVQTGGGDVQPTGGKPAMAGRSRTFGAMSLDGMDLQYGGTTQNGGANKTFAMNESLTNGRATNGVDAVKTDNEATEPMTGNGQRNDVSTEQTTIEPTADEHNGANMNESSDQES